ncbi:MAG: hypothetical protein LBE18_04445 [Planctomycetaceae bacterium]|nr:hypothetical protein [Planctomycetaceae bacterium]
MESKFLCSCIAEIHNTMRLADKKTLATSAKFSNIGEILSCRFDYCQLPSLNKNNF